MHSTEKWNRQLESIEYDGTGFPWETLLDLTKKRPVKILRHVCVSAISSMCDALCYIYVCVWCILSGVHLCSLCSYLSMCDASVFYCVHVMHLVSCGSVWFISSFVCVCVFLCVCLCDAPVFCLWICGYDVSSVALFCVCMSDLSHYSPVWRFRFVYPHVNGVHYSWRWTWHSDTHDPSCVSFAHIEELDFAQSPFLFHLMLDKSRGVMRGHGFSDIVDNNGIR